MKLATKQIRELFVTDVHFPPHFPDVAGLELYLLDVVTGDLNCGSQQTNPELPVIEVIENGGSVRRIVPLANVQAVFFPVSARPEELDLDLGLWVYRPALQIFEYALTTITAAKTSISGNVGNPNAQGIVFVDDTARILNVLSVGESAQDSLYLDVSGHARGGPCC